WHARADEVRDVAIDGPLRDLELVGDLPRRRQLAAAEELDDAEEPIGAAHFVSSCTRSSQALKPFGPATHSACTPVRGVRKLCSCANSALSATDSERPHQ